MTNEEKELLSKDLYARLLYGVHCIVYKMNGNIREEDDIIRYIELDNVITYKSKDDECFMLNQIKPYLRPMSSMTEDEKIEFRGFISWQFDCNYQANTLIEVLNGNDIDIDYMVELFDWLNEHHFDYRNLIDKGLALEAPAGMYNK